MREDSVLSKGLNFGRSREARDVKELPEWQPKFNPELRTESPKIGVTNPVVYLDVCFIAEAIAVRTIRDFFIIKFS